ncbi:MAG TPA: hypothetical protein VEA16_14705, partial [Vicinamibacterales bacterium]|nr:hypothetical protein [Vicinamibacterales bacterium]
MWRWRPKLGRLPWRRPAAAMPTTDLPRTVDEIDRDIHAQLAMASTSRLASSRRSTAIAKQLGLMAAEDPAHAARLLRTWLGDESRSR